MEGFRAWGFQSSSGVVPPPPPSGWLLDGNTEGAEHYIGTDDAFDFPIRTNGVEVARFLTTGELGLGVVAPTERLQVAGNIAPEANGTRDLGTPALGWLNLYLSSNIHYQSTLLFQSGGTQKLSLDTSGFMLFNNNQGIDVVTTVGSDVLNIGTGNADVINIGWSGANVNIMGNTFYENVTQLQVKDKLFTVNKGGAVGSGASAGFEIEEGGIITGQFSTSATRDGWYFLAPAIGFSTTLLLSGLTSNQTLTVQDASGTIAYLSDILPVVVANAWLQDGNTNGSEKYIGTNDTFDLPIYTDGGEVARFLTTGEFGIGTGSPTEKLTVEGNIAPATSVTHTLGTDTLRWSSLYLGSSIYYSADLNFIVGSTTLALLTTTGRFGINTASPVTKFHMSANDSTSIAVSDRYSGDTSATAFFGRKARGTQALPTQVLSGDAISEFLGAGYHSGGAFGGATGSLRFYAAQDFTASAQGMNFGIFTTPLGSVTAPTERLTVTSQGKIKATTSFIDLVTYAFDNYATGVDGNGFLCHSSAYASGTSTGHKLGRYDGATFYQIASFVTDTTSLAQFGMASVATQTVPLVLWSDSGTNPIFSFFTETKRFGINISAPQTLLHVFGVDATTLINSRLEPIANVTEDTTGATITTSDAGVTTLQTIAIPTDTGLIIECHITARKTGGVGVGTTGDVNGYVRTVKAKNVGGVVTIGVIQTDFTSEDIAFNATFDVNVTDVRVRVTGAVDDNVTWNTITKTYKVA